MPDGWFQEGRRYPQIGLNAVAGKRPEDYGLDPVRHTGMIPGCYDPQARLADMDLDAVRGAGWFVELSTRRLYSLP